MTNWKKIWENRAISNLNYETIPLQDLISADGFDTGAGKIDVECWKHYLNFISQRINIEQNDSIFEVGCGGGAFLYLLYKQGHSVGGIDYSKSLIALANTVMRGQDFRICEAKNLDVENKYDIVLANGVFHYFKDYDYALDVLERMVTKTLKTVAILEIPDLALREESERVRMGALPLGEYKKKYGGLSHLYYSREWFIQFAEENDYKITIFDQNIQNYVNNRFRFNVVLKK